MNTTQSVRNRLALLLDSHCQALLNNPSEACASRLAVITHYWVTYNARLGELDEEYSRILDTYGLGCSYLGAIEGRQELQDEAK